MSVKPKPRKIADRTKKAPPRRSTLQPSDALRPTVRASFPLPEPPRSSSGGATGISSFLVVLGLLCAIACFTIALVPATYMRWRPAVVFVSERHVDLTVVGVALLTIALGLVILGKVF